MPKIGFLAHELFDRIDDIGNILRVAGAVAEEDAVGIDSQYVFGLGRGREDGQAAVIVDQFAQDIAFGAVIHNGT